jgi:alpha-amylase/alpha-mannosidase (GH57 family)
MSDSAKEQMVDALNRLEKVFGIKIKGSWMPEMGLNQEVIQLLSDLNIKWTLADEGILSKSSNYNFERDYQGHLENPYHLVKPYKNNNVSIIFSDSLINDMINYEYANKTSDEASKDLYDRIKVIQDKLKNSPDENHLVTIALDCENCWNYYSENGRNFLEKVYSLIEEDETLETVLVREYLDKDIHSSELKEIKSGAGKNRDFQMWIGEPVKNLAWTYLKNVKKDMDKFISQNKKGINAYLAKKELYLCQGSDWFWWYGEPNNSGQDHLFDFLFREHLKSVYKYLNEEYPKYLDIPLISTIVTDNIENDIPLTPLINGNFNDSEWEKAHHVEVPEGPELQGQKIFEKIYYCADRDNFYIRLYLAQNTGDVNPFLHQMYIYMKNSQREQIQSSVRLICKNENISPVMKEKFHNELRISMLDKKLYPIRFTKAIDNNLWTIQNSDRIKVVYNDKIDIAIPFEDLDIKIGETMQFFFANTNYGIKDAFSPQDIMLCVKRF